MLKGWRVFPHFSSRIVRALKNAALVTFLNVFEEYKSSAWTKEAKYFYVFQKSRKMEIFQGSSKDHTWKGQIRGATMIWEKAIPRGKAAGGLEKIKKPARKWPGTEKVRSAGGLTSVVMWMKTSLGARKLTPRAVVQTQSHPGPVTIHPTTTGWEKSGFSERASAASRRRGNTRKKTAMIIYFSLSKGRKKRSCKVVLTWFSC